LPSGRGAVERLSEFEFGSAGLYYKPASHFRRSKEAVWAPLQVLFERPLPGTVNLPEELYDCGRGGVEPFGKELSKDDVQELATAAGEAFDGTCPICLTEVSGTDDCPAFQLQCGHLYHKDCIQHWFQNKKKCPTCQHGFGKMTGSQPRVGFMSWRYINGALPGHEETKETIVVHFNFPKGVDDHGVEYQGRGNKCFLPASNEGFMLLELFKVAFRRRVMYGLGESLSRNVYRPTFNIHIKTNRKRGVEGHGYPDASYFSRALEELRDNGVTISDLL
jgi:deltex-like protein